MPARKNLKNCIIILDRDGEQAEKTGMTRPFILLTPGFAAVCALLLLAPAHGDVLNSPAKYDFKTAVVTPETNRQATIDAAKFIDPAKPDCGIQAAIDALPPQGGEVVLPEGEFIIRKSLRLRSGVLLRGQGAKTVLALPSPLVHAKLTQPIREGDTELVVDDASGFTPGMEISVTSSPTRMLAFFTRTTPDAKQLYLPYIQVFVAAVKDNRIKISAPLSNSLKAAEAGNDVANFFPMIFAQHVSEVEVRDLEIVGRDEESLDIRGDYMAAAITFLDATRSKICNVTVRGWKGDGFSFQLGENNLFTECQALNARTPNAKGFHPGSVQNESIITRCVADGCQGPGLFFCREVKFSVMGNSILNNNGEMVGGFSAFYDNHNVCNRNYGENNKLGVNFGEGSDHVFVGNTLVNTREFPIEFVGDSRMKKPEAPNWWPRYHVVAGNTIVNQGETAKVAPLILIRPNTSACVVANNAFQSADDALAVKDEAPNLNVVVNNHPLKGAIPKPQVPQAPPALPAIAVDAAPFYDPAKPDGGFQAALDKAGKKGGRVQLPAGVYSLTKGLVVPSNVSLCGAGRATVLLWQGAGPAISSEKQSGIAIRGLTIRQPAENAQAAQAISIKNGSGVLIESVLVDDIKGVGIELAGTTDVLISQTMVTGCETGYDCNDTKGLTIAESWSLRNRGDGIRIANAAGGTVIDSSIVSGNRGCGIAVEKARDLSVLSSVITESGKNGISLRDCAGGVVQGSIVHRGEIAMEGKFPPAAAILLAGTTNKIQIRENLVGERKWIPTAKIAVEETDTADANTIQFNILASKDDAGDVLRITGKNTKVADNILKPSPLRWAPPKAAAR